MQNVRFEYDQPDARPAIIFDNVQDASVNGLTVKGTEGMEALRFINTKDILVTAARLLTTTSSFLRVEGASSEGIIINGGDLRKASKPIEFENESLRSAATIS
jgi:hypothetical protein